MNKQDYYVYVHRRLDNNEIFYVGSGRANRYKSTNSRSKQWKLTVDEYGFVPEILTQGLTQQEARELEGLVIEMLPNLDNQRKPTETQDLFLYFDFLDSIFYVDETSSTGLRYKKNRYKNKGATSKRAGDEAGQIKYLPNGKPRGFRVKLTFPDGVKKELPVHRIVYLLLHKKLDSTLVIDHIDGNPLNNTEANLREVTQEQNTRNKKPKEGFDIQGVYLKNGRQWFCEITENNVRQTIGFSIKKYGYDCALQMAIEKRKEFLMQLKQKGIEYSERHIGFKLE